MSDYTDAVERGTEGMTAISSGSCPGCEACMERSGHTDEAEHHKAWQSGEINDEASFSHCACGICGTTLGGDRNVWHWLDKADVKARDDWHAQKLRMAIDAKCPPEPEVTINHEDDMCTDCVMFIAYGTEPEEWRKR